MPLVGPLLSIALFALLAVRFWHHNHLGAVAAWALEFAAPCVATCGAAAAASPRDLAILGFPLVNSVPILLPAFILATPVRFREAGATARSDVGVCAPRQREGT